VQREPIVISEDEICRVAADKMAQNEVGRILVVSSQNPKNLAGIVTRSDLLKARHHHLKEEGHRERIMNPRMPVKV